MRVTLNKTKIIKSLEKQRALHGVPDALVGVSKVQAQRFSKTRCMTSGNIVALMERESQKEREMA